MLEVFIEVLCWLRIAASPTILGIVLGFLMLKAFGQPYGIWAGASVAVAGLLVGIVWATRVWKKKGTSNFMSRMDASPDFDKRSSL